MTDDRELTVTAVTDMGGEIRRIVLADPAGAPLPMFTAGSHVRVHLPDGRTNAYSLVDLDGQAAAPVAYVLGVRLDPGGAGGSRAMHALQPGDRVRVSAPRNDFALSDGDAPVLLVAGGIGVTPLVSMATELARRGRPWRMVYAARSAAAAAFADELAERHGAAITRHLDDIAGGPLDAAALVADAAPGSEIYVCGPRPMIDAVRRAAEVAGWAPGRVKSELFDAPAPEAGDTAFEIEVASTGAIHVVPPGRTIVEVLEDAGMDILHDCLRGDCGICQTTVLEGVPDHRDVVLTEAERAAGKVMQICVSRAKSPRLKLDL